MSSSSTRLERYLTIAACGSGVAGLAVSPLHGDIQHFSGQFTLSLPGGTSTQGSTSWNLSGGGVSWNIYGSRSASFYSTSSFTSNLSSFYQYRTSNSYSAIFWEVQGPSVAMSLFNAGDLIDVNAMLSATSYPVLHSRSVTNSFYFLSSSSSSGSSFSSRSDSFSSSYGILTPGGRGFLALSFDLDGETVYGWAAVTLSNDGLSLSVDSWAFEDSGEGILAGQTEDAIPVPGIGGLAALACGAAGLRRKRNRVA